MLKISLKKHRLWFVMTVFLLFFLWELSRDEEYNYASDIERAHCGAEFCPGEMCLCVIGENNTWYFDGTVGDIEGDVSGNP